jgi:AraC-like DNA-binding protein
LTAVVHTTAYPPPAASVGNNRYLYLLKLLREFDPEEHGTLKAYVGRQGLSYRQVQKDSSRFFGSPFYRHYLKLKMIRVVEDVLLSTLTYKEIAYKKGFSGYNHLYTLFHKSYSFPLQDIPRIAQDA